MNHDAKSLHPDSAIIDRLGGTAAVSRLCQIKSSSVSEWRQVGISKARRQLLQLMHPEAFGLPVAPALKPRSRRATVSASAAASASA
jgi:hypothetical protein